MIKKGDKPITTIRGTMTVPRVIEAMTTHTDSASSRYALGAIKLESDQSTGVGHAVATDGRRLAVVRFAAEVSGHVNTLISSKDLLTACRSAKPTTSRMALRPELRQISLTADDKTIESIATDGESEARLSMKPMEGRFPDWRSILKEDRHDGITVMLDAKFLKDAADLLLRVTTDSDARGVYLTIHDRDRPVYLSAQSSDMQTAAEIVLMPLESMQQRETPRVSVPVRLTTTAAVGPPGQPD